MYGQAINDPSREMNIDFNVDQPSAIKSEKWALFCFFSSLFFFFNGDNLSEISAPLSSRDNWSDRTTESGYGSGPLLVIRSEHWIQVDLLSLIISGDVRRQVSVWRKRLEGVQTYTLRVNWRSLENHRRLALAGEAVAYRPYWKNVV